MIRNYLKIAFRNLRRHKGHAVINVLGLAVGIACCVLIGLYVQDELSYDEFHENADRIYRVLREFDIPDLHVTIAGTPSALAPALEASVPDVEAAVRVLGYPVPVVQRGARKFAESGFIWADAGFFEMFSFPILRGKAALSRPGTVVLTKAMAMKYFPDENAVGQTLRVGDRTLEVTGVMANVPDNSSLQFDFVGSLKTRQPEPTWGLNNWLTYVLLEEGASKREVMPQIDAVVTANTQPEGEAAEVIGQGDSFIPHLQPLTGIHLGQGVPAEISTADNILYVYLFATLAVFILLLACINFMNLTTARATRRAKEVGVRKAVGAHRSQLAGQFLSEAVLISLMALLVGLVLARLALPAVNALSGKTLALITLYAGPWLLGLLGLTVGVGLLAGSYPALVLSRFEPAAVLRDADTSAGGSRTLRKGLVVFQFAISIAILVATGVVLRQLNFMTSAGLGFNEENLVVVERTQYLGDQLRTFKQELERLPGVRAVTSGYSMPGTFFINSMVRPATPGAEEQNVNYSFVGYDYVETLGIEMAAGRSFARARADTFAVMLNEAAVQGFGWRGQGAVGKELVFRGREWTVVGVMENFHYKSLHQEIYPMIFYGPYREQQYVTARVQPENIAATVEAIRATWEQFSDLPFQYSFLADELAAQYRAEQRLATVFGFFAALAIFIACLGLYGLASFTAERRTKEIGIRKTFGASVPSIVGLLSKDFLKLVGIAFIIAAPVAYFVMQRWLQDFAYRIDLGPWVFIGAGLAALVVALATVSYHAIRAARANPVDALRYE